MGRPVVHWEFWSEDPQKVSKFYQQVFDWKIQPIAELDYTLVETGGTGGINGGIMKPKQRSLARKTGPLHRCGRPRHVRKEDQAGGREDHRGAAGSTGRGTILTVRGSGWPGARNVEAAEIEFGAAARRGALPEERRRALRGVLRSRWVCSDLGFDWLLIH